MELTRQAWLALVMAVLLLCTGLLWFSLPLHTLDTRLVYSAQDVGTLMAELGAQGRATYARVALADLVFIALYGFMLLSIVAHLRARGALGPRGRAGLYGVGWLLIISDLAETSSAAWVLAQYPEHGTLAPQVAAVATPCKWVLAMAFAAGSTMVIARHARKPG